MVIGPAIPIPQPPGYNYNQDGPQNQFCFNIRNLHITLILALGVNITNMALVDELITKGVLKSKRLIEAFYAVDRKNFLPEN